MSGLFFCGPGVYFGFKNGLRRGGLRGPRFERLFDAYKIYNISKTDGVFVKNMRSGLENKIYFPQILFINLRRPSQNNPLDLNGVLSRKKAGRI